MSSSFTGDARRKIADIADRHGFKPEAGEAMAEALIRSGGGMAQFNHPDLGGMGQWSKGGMMMIGEMNNDRLKSRVGDLARDLSEAVHGGTIGEETASDDAASSPPSSSSSSSSGGSKGSWWPQSLGSPSSTGSQNNSRYAVFPDKNRVAVEDGGKVTVYDSGDERIEGASQQQGGDTSMRFSTRSGSVRVEDLEVADQGDAEDDVRAKRSAERASPARTPDPLGHGRPGDPIETIRRLAGLRDQGIVSEAEFAAKKTELLARL